MAKDKTNNKTTKTAAEVDATTGKKQWARLHTYLKDNHKAILAGKPPKTHRIEPKAYAAEIADLVDKQNTFWDKVREHEEVDIIEFIKEYMTENS